MLNFCDMDAELSHVILQRTSLQYPQTLPGERVVGGGVGCRWWTRSMVSGVSTLMADEQLDGVFLCPHSMESLIRKSGAT